MNDSCFLAREEGSEREDREERINYTVKEDGIQEEKGRQARRTFLG